jgi:low affinity Fe/Cu permease
MTHKPKLLEQVARRATLASGSSWAFALASTVILVWLVTGPIFGFSDTWQLVINTGTTIVTFLMVFLIQRAQNKDSLAIQLKLNEIVAAVRGASNRLINIEDLSEADVCTLHEHYQKLCELAKLERDLTESHSIEEAERRHQAHEHERSDTAHANTTLRSGANSTN